MAEQQLRTSLRTAVVWQVLLAELDIHASARLQIVDAGGGSGSFAVPLAERGHVVTVVDASPDALAALQRRAAEQGVADRIHAVQGDTDSLADLVADETADLVLCHSVLEHVDDPVRTVAALRAVLRPGGAVSVVVANKAATLLARVLSGRLVEARHVLDSPAGRWGAGDPVRRRFDANRATDLLTAAGLRVESVHGARVLVDLVPSALLDAEAGSLATLRDLELAVAELPPYRDVATQLHLLGRRV